MAFVLMIAAIPLTAPYTLSLIAASLACYFISIVLGMPRTPTAP